MFEPALARVYASCSLTAARPWDPKALHPKLLADVQKAFHVIATGGRAEMT